MSTWLFRFIITSLIPVTTLAKDWDSSTYLPIYDTLRLNPQKVCTVKSGAMGGVGISYQLVVETNLMTFKDGRPQFSNLEKVGTYEIEINKPIDIPFLEINRALGSVTDQHNIFRVLTFKIQMKSIMGAFPVTIHKGHYGVYLSHFNLIENLPKQTRKNQISHLIEKVMQCKNCTNISNFRNRSKRSFFFNNSDNKILRQVNLEKVCRETLEGFYFQPEIVEHQNTQSTESEGAVVQ